MEIWPFACEKGDPTYARRTKARGQKREDKWTPTKMRRQLRVDNCALTSARTLGYGMEHRLFSTRLFVFLTDRNIDTREQNAHLFMDGTFKVAPELFVQLFTIHALGDSRALPMGYVLLQSKCQADYERVFRKLLEIRNTLSPSSILLDFEKATLQASAAVFPQTTLTGCLFHLGQ